jgi:hypothetical protein
MHMLPQLEREFLQADLAQVRALLHDTSPAEEPIEHFQFSQRASALESRLAELTDELADAPAGLAIFFGGKPVVGSQGIKATFSTRAVGYFQKLVSQRFAADEQGPLSRHGRVPMADDTQLLVTDVVRGSFGFVLQATRETADKNTSLKQVVDEVADTLSKLAASEEALSDEASAVLDDRQLGTLREFFKLLDDEGASLRLVEGARDFELDQKAIGRARSRVEALTIDDRTEAFEGKIVGWTQFSRRFELLTTDNTVLQGEVAPEVIDAVTQENTNPLHLLVKIQCKVREVRSRGRPPRLRYLLKAVHVLPQL